jgi:hypothetical protein
LNNSRPSGFGVSAIPYSEIQAFCNLMDINIEPWEVEIIKMFDSIAMDMSRKEQEKQEQAQKSKSKH